MKNLECSNFMQMIEIIGILPNRVCGSARSNRLMYPQFTNYFPFETEGAESEDGNILKHPKFSNYFLSETEDAESEDGDISMDSLFSNYFPSETEGTESEDGDISMDPQLSNHFTSETEGDESEDGDTSMDPQFSNYIPSKTKAIDRFLSVSGTEIPKWFNHQSVENSILFWVGRKFPRLAVCIALGPDGAHKLFHDCFVYISINGCEKHEYRYFHPFEINYNLLFLFSPHQGLLQQQLNESNPTDQNHVEVTYRTIIEPQNPTFIKRCGVHVECTCRPQESVIPNLPHLTAAAADDVVDCLSEMPSYGSEDIEEYQSPPVLDNTSTSCMIRECQSPLVLDDTSMSCMSWLVGPKTKLFKLLCFCCPRDFS